MTPVNLPYLTLTVIRKRGRTYTYAYYLRDGRRRNPVVASRLHDDARADGASYGCP